MEMAPQQTLSAMLIPFVSRVNIVARDNNDKQQ